MALIFVPGIGTALGLGAISLGAGLGSIAVATLVGLGLEIAGSLLMGPSTPKGLTTNPISRLQATLIPTTPRKIVVGNTALDTDVRYQAYTGSNQEYLDQIVCNASHEVHSQDELWLDNELAWSASGGVQGRYVGYLTVQAIPVGTSSNGIAIDGTWTVHCTLTGCAYLHIRYKLTGNSSSQSSPFSSGVTSRMTVRGKGAKFYDPRLDSTVAGGSGSMRATDQTTWAWDDNASRNPALAELFYELGWQINGKLAVGKGVPPARIDLASYAVAANHCDESITLNGGGTEPRYRCDGVVSESDDPGAVRDQICATMNAMLRDAGGKLSLTVIVNDLATPVTPAGKSSFDQFDVQAELQWEQTPDLHQTFNVVRGQRIDPSNTALYQPVDFPEVRLTSNDGIDRIDTFNLPLVQSNGQAQRLAKQRLERNQFQGKLTFTGLPSFWGINLGDPFPLSHPAFGWSTKLFRCASQQISRTGATQIVAVEENSAIYAWANNEAAAVVPGTPTVYDPSNNPLLINIGAPGDSNRVRFSQFEQGTHGWNFATSGGTPTISFLDITTVGGLDYFEIVGAFTAASEDVALAPDSPAAGGTTQFGIPVTPGERIFVGGLVGIQIPEGGAWQLAASFKDATNATVSGGFIAVASGTVSVFTGTEVGDFVVVPATSKYLSLELGVESNSATSGGFIARLSKPLVCGAGTAQTIRPAFTPGPSAEPGAQVIRTVDGPAQRTSFKYDYTGTAQSGEFSRDLTFQLLTTSGVLTASGWSYTVLTGTVNGFTSASGAQAMTGTSLGDLTVASLGSSTATVQITATYNGQPYSKQITLTQDVAAAPVTTGGGGGGGGPTTIATKTSGFASFNSTTFLDDSGTGGIVGTTPSGSTSATVAVNLDVNPASTPTSGSWTVEMKVMRDISGTPTQIGTTQSATSDWNNADLSGDPAHFSFTISDTGLTASTAYTWRIYVRITSGSKLHGVTGTVTVTA